MLIDVCPVCASASVQCSGVRRYAFFSNVSGFSVHAATGVDDAKPGIDDAQIMYGVLYAVSPEVFPAKDRGTGNALTATATRVFGIIVRPDFLCTCPAS